MMARTVSGLVALALLMLVAGCGLFETRQPAAGSGDSDWIPPLTAEQIVENLRIALENGSFNDYQRTFFDTFEFIPDQTDVAQMANERPGEPVYENWDADVETSTMGQIFSTADSTRLSLSLFEQRVEGDTRLLKYTYTLSLHRPGEVSEYRGEAWYRVLQRSGGEWAIARWEDVISMETDEIVGSWGRLKGRERIL